MVGPKCIKVDSNKTRIMDTIGINLLISYSSTFYMVSFLFKTCLIIVQQLLLLNVLFLRTDKKKKRGMQVISSLSAGSNPNVFSSGVGKVI